MPITEAGDIANDGHLRSVPGCRRCDELRELHISVSVLGHNENCGFDSRIQLRQLVVPGSVEQIRPRDESVLPGTPRRMSPMDVLLSETFPRPRLRIKKSRRGLDGTLLLA
jgi:hypothetical protein